MPTNSEFYERGALDAERDELNPYYYQHYYYYRRGYNEMRRRQRSAGRGPTLLPGLALAVLAVAMLAGGAGWLLGRGRAPVEAQALVASPLPAPTAPPTAAPALAATATAAPTPGPALALGGRAWAINLSGSPLRAREAPGLAAAVVARISEGAQVTLRDGPVTADGLTWWRVEAAEGAGWVAERSPEGAPLLAPSP